MKIYSEFNNIDYKFALRDKLKKKKVDLDAKLLALQDEKFKSSRNKAALNQELDMKCKAAEKQLANADGELKVISE
jgi:hypothetical protein